MPQAKFLHKTGKGNVYALPLDNMPCLVPDELYTMAERKQYKQHYLPEYIPNASEKNTLIPLQLNGKISGIKVYPPVVIIR